MSFPVSFVWRSEVRGEDKHINASTHTRRGGSEVISWGWNDYLSLYLG